MPRKPGALARRRLGRRYAVQLARQRAIEQRRERKANARRGGQPYMPWWVAARMSTVSTTGPSRESCSAGYSDPGSLEFSGPQGLRGRSR